MALSSTKGEIPSNAIVLTQREAIQYRWKQIHNWVPKREVWPFSYGPALLGGVASISSLYINIRIRNIMKLRSFGLASSTISMALCPGVFTILAQMEFVTEKVFLPVQTCPLCIQINSLIAQNFCSLVYPLILSPVVNLMIAKRAGTFRMPYYTNWKEVLYFGVNLCKPIVPSLAVLSTINSLAAMLILYKQFNCISYIEQILTINEESDEMNTTF
ncbi:PREDICTED: uncharacterized protein LOC106794037 [Polistes canadensis]|uniref:uncharacterized protein LOC106794037 n=1 Tax=Polistes canadensis TaxID=91411 RepID=UPI000718DB6F|nr:PREDICTED: uncharacterized protein LOC106794037 [Polistes canadensis]